jgi:hypothetical protein
MELNAVQNEQDPAAPAPERPARVETEREVATDVPPPETARRPVPGVKHEPEPDAGNIMPAEDEPGTL